MSNSPITIWYEHKETTLKALEHYAATIARNFATIANQYIIEKVDLVDGSKLGVLTQELSDNLYDLEMAKETYNAINALKMEN